MSVLATDIRGKILSLLRTSSGVISGDELARQLTADPEQSPTSRVAIWKHIKKLQELGYPIEVSAKGYALQDTSDLLQPWEFPGREHLIRFYPAVDSTMTTARQLAEQGALHGTVVIAGCQEKGRGRLQRNWLSHEGGLYFTIILRVNLPLQFCYRYNFAASLALLHTLKELYHLQAVVKWPNDVLISGLPASSGLPAATTEKKIAGILSDMRIESEMILYLNLGIGVNLNNFPAGEVPTACSVRELKGQAVSKKEFMQNFLNNWDNYQIRLTHEDLVQEWKENTISLNRRVQVTTPQSVLTGLAVDLDEEGALILKKDDGSLEKIIYGDCHNVY